jgi:hypothetical protein
MMEGISKPETTEAMTCIKGLSLVSELKLWKVRIATGRTYIVKDFQGYWMDPYVHIIREIIKVGMTSFTLMEIVHESRNSKVDVHRLAKSLIYEIIWRHIWLLSPPHKVCND